MLIRRVIQASRPLTRVARPRPSITTMLQTGRTQTRLSSTSQPSPHSAFYKTFGRPIAKSLLIAILTYQMIYLLWMKLEADETKADKNAEIAELEGKVMEMQGRKSS